MGRRGPPPKPTALRLIDGVRPSRINQAEPCAAGLLPECPPEISPAVRAIWDYTVRELVTMQTAYAADRDALICYCEAVVTHRKTCALLAKSDVLVKGKEGKPVRNPLLAVQRDSASVIRAFAQEFGLTPSARTRIEVNRIQAGNDNPFAGTG